MGPLEMWLLLAVIAARPPRILLPALAHAGWARSFWTALQRVAALLGIPQRDTEILIFFFFFFPPPTFTSSSPNFYILDEPTNHLDMETIEALAKALNKFRVRLPELQTGTGGRSCFHGVHCPALCSCTPLTPVQGLGGFPTMVGSRVGCPSALAPHCLSGAGCQLFLGRG